MWRLSLATILVIASACGWPFSANSTPAPKCQPPTVIPVRFEDSVGPSAQPRPFAAGQFSGLGKVLSVGADGRSVTAELVEPTTLQVFAATTIQVTSSTNFDYGSRISAPLRAGGTKRGSMELQLGPGAPSVPAGEHVVIECQQGSASMVGEGTRTAEAAPAGATSWKLASPLANSWPQSAQVYYEEKVHVAHLEDLQLGAGQTVQLEFEGRPGDYRATRLTKAGFSYRWN